MRATTSDAPCSRTSSTPSVAVGSSEDRFAAFVRSPREFAIAELQNSFFDRRLARDSARSALSDTTADSPSSGHGSSDFEPHSAVTTVDDTFYDEVCRACPAPVALLDATHSRPVNRLARVTTEEKAVPRELFSVDEKVGRNDETT